MSIPAYNKAIFVEQLNHSKQEMDRLIDIPTVEAGEELRYHASLINDIGARLDIYKELQEGIKTWG